MTTIELVLGGASVVAAGTFAVKAARNIGTARLAAGTQESTDMWLATLGTTTMVLAFAALALNNFDVAMVWAAHVAAFGTCQIVSWFASFLARRLIKRRIAVKAKSDAEWEYRVIRSRFHMVVIVSSVMCFVDIFYPNSLADFYLIGDSSDHFYTLAGVLCSAVLHFTIQMRWLEYRRGKSFPRTTEIVANA